MCRHGMTYRHIATLRAKLSLKTFIIVSATHAGDSGVTTLNAVQSVKVGAVADEIKFMLSLDTDVRRPVYSS